MINFHCTIIPVVVLDNVITHTNAWFLDREIHQLVFLCNFYCVNDNNICNSYGELYWRTECFQCRIIIVLEIISWHLAIIHT